jgi:hypothetical protein
VHPFFAQVMGRFIYLLYYGVLPCGLLWVPYIYTMTVSILCVCMLVGCVKAHEVSSSSHTPRS